ncbi:type I polyketide synthase [Chitinophaga sp. Ak27]|uniref:type I polyketide synthase n=1 Tax=Chitinophaga sp. Ak27 TaxID=2726116 RepID=UPI00145D74CB|nr:type I polyketide synthase [Chitinophaga sp. Ak27]NLU93279.1 acyltransferase domain-containing protein [Chitinophaga sp. Ak27]
MTDKTQYIQSLAGTEIAVVGLALRFPGADNSEQFWERLVKGDEMVKYFSDGDLDQLGVSDNTYNKPEYVKVVAQAPFNKDYFDHHFFSYTPEEAKIMDPQTRIFHELCWEALESAGFAKDIIKNKIGIFAGGSSSFSHELLNNLTGRAVEIGPFNAIRLGNKDYMCSRVAYALNLTGPCYSINTTCSTSMSAIHLATRAILTGDCKMALAGGVCIFPDKARGYLYEEGGVLSNDGHCRAFDAASSGTYFAEGAGVVVLKRLKEALEDGDTIQAIIKGTAVNNDGRRKVGYTAPSIEGQKEVIRLAHKLARVNPATISMIEAHGTGTPLGDPIEMEALRQAFDSPGRNCCAIGSVKTNIGHLDSAAGIAGLIKTVLSLKHKAIPASLHFDTPNPKIDFANSPFYVNDVYRKWENTPLPRRAGVSSFGIGGTNVHVVLEEAPDFRELVPSTTGLQLLPLSAKTKKALQQSQHNLSMFLSGQEQISINDVSYTLQEGREEFSHRLFFLASDTTDAANILTGQSDGIYMGKASETKKVPIFMFPGQGSQYAGMAGELYDTLPVFRSAVDRCLELLTPSLASEIKQVMVSAGDIDVTETRLTQPLLFVIQYALSQALITLGIKPAVMIGHSLGEYVAACISGVFSLEDALKIVEKRGMLMQRSSEGSMIAVSLSEEEIQSYLLPGISLAAVNGRCHCVLSGSPENITATQELLEANQVGLKKLHTDRAFHSELMDEVLEEFEDLLMKVSFRQPEIPFISGLTGTYITAAEATDVIYWVQHLRHTIRFGDGLQTLESLKDKVFIEVGTSRALSSYVRENASDRKIPEIIALLRHPRESVSDNAFFLKAVGSLWLLGYKIDWMLCRQTGKAGRVPLPTYPFERKKFSDDKDVSDLVKELLQRNPAESAQGNIFVPSWKRSGPLPGGNAERRPVLFAGNSSRLSEMLSSAFLEQAVSPIVVRYSKRYNVVNDLYNINTDDPNAIDTLFDSFKAKGFVPRLILVDILYAAVAGGGLTDEAYTHAMRGLLEVLAICRSFNAAFPGEPTTLRIVLNNACEITGDDLLLPLHAGLHSLAAVINNEYRDISCAVIDIDLLLTEASTALLADELLILPERKPAVCITGIRNGFRWQPCREPVIWRKTESTGSGLPKHLLITGGLGGVGLAVAEHFASRSVRNITLVSRTELPDPDSWDHWLAVTPAADPVCVKIRKILHLKSFSINVWHFSADVADEKKMEEVVTAASSLSGYPIDAIIHAAGIPSRRIIERTTAAEMDRQWRAKVRGLMVLNQLFAKEHLLFFINFSSISAIDPGFAQAGYSTANAVLDAFIYANGLKYCAQVKTINWDTWKETGMALESEREKYNYLQQIKLNTIHPLIGYVATDIEEDLVFVSHFTPEELWILNEHRVVHQLPVFPGTGYIELIYAAINHIVPGGAVTISHLFLTDPMVFQPGESKVVKTIVTAKTHYFNVKIVSSAANKERIEGHHAVAEVSVIPVPVNAPRQLSDLAGLVEKKTWINQQELTSTEFGPRWNNLQWISLQGNEGVAGLRLPDVYTGDIGPFKLHPALMDIATGFLYFHVKENKQYLPYCYEKIVITGPLTPHITSHIVLRGDKSKELIFDITIWNEKEEVVVTVSGLIFIPYTPGKPGESGRKSLPAGAKVSDEPTLYGLSTAENLEIFQHFLCHNYPHIAVRANHPSEKKTALLSASTEEDGTDDRNEREDMSTPYVAPVTAVEKQLALEWERFFGINQLGTADDFFELGGDSIMVSIILSRINKLFTVNISLTQFFNNATIAKLAVIIDKGTKSGPSSINKAEKRAYYALSAAQRRIYILERMFPQSTLYNITEAFVVDGRLDPAKLEAALQQLLNRHESLRTSIVVVNGIPYQRIHEEISAVISYHTATENEVTEKLHAFRKPFDMSSAPFIRVGVFGVHENKHHVVIDLLHLVADGSSLLLLINEFLSLYNGNTLAVLPRQYKDFAEWQSRLLKTTHVQAQQRYWEQQLSGQLQGIHLPYDFAKTNTTSKAAANYTFSFSPEVSDKLRAFSRKMDATYFMTWTALLNVFFYRLSGQEDILLAIPHAGRNHDDFVNVVGMFINTVILRNYPSAEKSFVTVLSEVKSNTLAAFEHLDFQFEFILEMLRKSHQRTDQLLNVFFNYRNMFVRADEGGATDEQLSVNSAGMEDNFAKFDLSLYAYDFKSVFSFTCNYNKSLFAPETISYLMNQFVELVSAIMENPSVHIGEYRVLGRTQASV